eukprot:403788-Prymnesium_polylepis.1
MSLMTCGGPGQPPQVLSVESAPEQCGLCGNRTHATVMGPLSLALAPIATIVPSLQRPIPPHPAPPAQWSLAGHGCRGDMA